MEGETGYDAETPYISAICVAGVDDNFGSAIYIRLDAAGLWGCTRCCKAKVCDLDDPN